jgi:uncharacterized membrane protein YecN with MAPEG domain
LQGPWRSYEGGEQRRVEEFAVPTPISAAYAAVLALMFIALSVRTLRLRGSFKVALGSGGHEQLERAVRAHGNFAEYVPLALLVLAFAEAQGTPSVGIHALGASLLLGRGLHALGVSRSPEPMPLRVAGMALTLAALGGAALAVLAMRGA